MTNTIFLEAGSNYVLEFSYRIPDIWVGNPSVTSASPVAPNQLMVVGLKPGVCTLTVSDPDKRLQAITVHVRHNVRSLEAAVGKHFPNATIQVHALNEGVVIRGEMTTADEVHDLMEIANDFFPDRIINQVSVSGSQMIAIKVRVYEVARQKLRALGVDWSVFGENFYAIQSVSGLIQAMGNGAGSATGVGQTFSFGIIDENFRLDAFLKALEQKNLAKLLDEPTLVTENGRAAEFLSGGEVPIQISTNFGGTSLEFKSFGTKLDIVPLIHGQGEMTLEVRAEVSDVAGDLSGGTNTPGFRVRRVNTGVRMKAGQTLALAGDYREETETIVRGIPGLMDIPGLGVLFRSTQEQTTETELVFLITPEFISAVETGRCAGPGQSSRSPAAHDFYFGGSVEVCPEDAEGKCGVAYNCQSGNTAGYASQSSYSSQAGSGQSKRVPSQYYSPDQRIVEPQVQPNQEFLPPPNRQFQKAPEMVPPSVINQPTTFNFSDEPPPPSRQLESTVPPIPASQIEKASSPARDMNLPNPFENRATPEFNGPYGYSG